MATLITTAPPTMEQIASTLRGVGQIQLRALSLLLDMSNNVLTRVWAAFPNERVTINHRGNVRVRLAPKVSILIKPRGDKVKITVQANGKCMCGKGHNCIVGVERDAICATVAELLSSVDANSISSHVVATRIENINTMMALTKTTNDASYYYDTTPDGVTFDKPHCAELAAAGRAHIVSLKL